MNKINSSGLDSVIKKIEEINKTLITSSASLNKNVNLFNKGLKASNKAMVSMKKTSSAILSNFRLATLAVASMAAGKAKEVLNSYGGAGASFRAASNKSSKNDDIALNRAFKLSTGDEQKGLQDTLGKFASRGSITGSKEQQLLLQSGIDPSSFANMNQIDRLNKLMEMYSKRGNDINFLEQIEELTGMSKGELDALNNQLGSINEQYKKQSKNLKDINLSGFENINTLWDETMFYIQDTLAKVFAFLPTLTKEMEPFINTIKKVYEYLTSSATFGEHMDKLKVVLGNVWELVKRLANAIGSVLGPVLEWIVSIISPILDVLAVLTDPSNIDEMCNRLKFLWDYIKTVFANLVDRFSNLGLYMDTFFLSIKKAMYSALDSIPLLDFSNEIKDVNQQISNANDMISTNKSNIEHRNSMVDSYDRWKEANNIVVNVSTNDVSRINNTSARVISK